jgi:hypothetical protein
MGKDNTPPAEEDKNPVGRPLKFKTVAELDMAIQAYFDEQDPHIIKHMEATGFNERGQTTWAQRDIMTEQRPYTMSGLARALGMSRQGLLDYSNRDEFADSIAASKQRCEEYWEGLLASPFANGAKFNLNNNYQGKYVPWAEKQVIAGDPEAPLGNPLAGLTTEQLRKLAEAEPDQDPNSDGDTPSDKD